MSDKVIDTIAHDQAGGTYLAFSLDGSYIYTGGQDAIVRVWDAKKGKEHEPDVALDAMKPITSLAASEASWFSGSEDAEVRQYTKGTPEFEGLIANTVGVAVRCVAIDPRSKRVAVTSDETEVKVIDLSDITKMVVLKGHTKAVRRATWHPSGSLLTTCGADGKIMIWDVSEEEPKQLKVIEGIIPAAADTESMEFAHDCSAVWHTSGQYFFVATRTHEIITISRKDWSKSSTFSDDSSSGAITALTLSANGIYLASSSKAGLFIWSTQNRRLLFRFQASLNAPITQLAFSPTQNLLAWTDVEGHFTRWLDPIPGSAPDPVKMVPGAVGMGAAVPVRVERKKTPTLFDDVADTRKDEPTGHEDGDEDIGMVDLDAEGWVEDDIGGGIMEDDGERKRWGAEDGVREMVSVTKAQPAFQPGSTPMENRKRYLAFNMIGVVDVTEQDEHQIVNVDFHDKSTRRSYHFTDDSLYDLAALGERGALFACQPKNQRPSHVKYKPYGTWVFQEEWEYELPIGTRVLGVAAGGPPPIKSLRNKSDHDLLGNGNVVIATSTQELIFLTGGGVERMVLSLQGDFVSMVAGPEWVFVVHRDGSTTMDGSQNLTGRLIKFDDFCLLQKDSLPIPKGHTLKWVGITEEGAPVIYDSTGVVHVLPRFRLPFAATWSRLLDTNSLERREGKQESYWPVGVSGDIFMCLILKGRQEYPGFPRPLIQELPIRLPFKLTDPKDGPLEENFARENQLLDILRDGLDDDELTTESIARRELALDKILIQLIFSACKNNRLCKALDLAKLLHHTASFDGAIKVADRLGQIGLQEKIEALKDDRYDFDRLEEAREKRRARKTDFAAIPAPKAPRAEKTGQKAFQDFRPPPTIHRPGLERISSTAGPSKLGESSVGAAGVNGGSSQISRTSTIFQDEVEVDDYASVVSPDGKRKRGEGQVFSGLGDAGPKRQAIPPVTGSNPFARKPGTDTNRNPFNRTAEMNKSLHKSDSFFNKVDQAEVDKTKRGPINGKGKKKESQSVGRQTTLFGLPSVPAQEKKSTARNKKATESQQTGSTETGGGDSQATEIISENSQETQLIGSWLNTQDDDKPPSQVSTEGKEPEIEEDDEVIDWPPSPPAGGSLALDAAMADVVS